jgi:hypothetical protein
MPIISWDQIEMRIMSWKNGLHVLTYPKFQHSWIDNFCPWSQLVVVSLCQVSRWGLTPNVGVGIVGTT